MCSPLKQMSYSGFSASSTAEEVTSCIDGSSLVAIVTGYYTMSSRAFGSKIMWFLIFDPLVVSCPSSNSDFLLTFRCYQLILVIGLHLALEILFCYFTTPLMESNSACPEFCWQINDLIVTSVSCCRWISWDWSRNLSGSSTSRRPRSDGDEEPLRWWPCEGRDWETGSNGQDWHHGAWPQLNEIRKKIRKQLRSA